MALFKSLFGGKTNNAKAPKGFTSVIVKDIVRLSNDAVKVVIDRTYNDWKFSPGQYLNIYVNLNGDEIRRSYSICSGPDENIAIGVKKVQGGLMSTYLTEQLEVGTEIFVSKPEGSFGIDNDAKNILAIAAGSGITPILSIAKFNENGDKNIQLLYGSRTFDSILFRDEINTLNNTSTNYFLSGETKEGFETGRIDKDKFLSIIKADLSLLRYDNYIICGPEEMIIATKEVLTSFGVQESKIKYELFTTPVKLKSETALEENDFEGKAHVTVYIDDEKASFDLDSKGLSILDAAANEGLDVPYSCKGGVCSTCRAKVTKGKATMTMNYSLTDREVEEGYILSCQAHPASEEIEITYDA